MSTESAEEIAKEIVPEGDEVKEDSEAIRLPEEDMKMKERK